MLLIFLMILAIKLPLFVVGGFLYRVIHDVPKPDLANDDGDFVRAEYGPGPRSRGPHGGGLAAGATLRRGNVGHEDAEQRPAVGVESQAD